MLIILFLYNKEMFSHDYSLFSGATEKLFYVQDSPNNSSNLNEAGTNWGDVTVNPSGSTSISYGPSFGLRTIDGNLSIKGSDSNYISLGNIRINGNLRCCLLIHQEGFGVVSLSTPYPSFGPVPLTDALNSTLRNFTRLVFCCIKPKSKYAP